MKTVRPAIVRSTAEGSCVHRSDPLFLNFEGKQEDEIGRLVNRYFKRKLHLHITTTAIRSLVSTNAHDLKAEGIISESTLNAVNNINGHSSQMVEAHYLMSDRIRDVERGRKMFEAMFRRDDVVATGENAADGNSWTGLSAKPGWQHMPWGTAHPDFGKKGRAQWDRKELDFMDKWIKNEVATQSFERKNIMSMFLKFITVGPGHKDALPIFHSRHILDSARLRHGYRIIRNDRPSRFHGSEDDATENN